MSDVYNAAERADVRRATKAARVADRQRVEIVTQNMSTPAGRAWILDILEAAHIFASSFTTDALSTAFREGERNIGLRLLNDIMTSCPDQYITMMRESNERHAARTSERSGSKDGDGGDQGPTGDDPDPGTDSGG